MNLDFLSGIEEVDLMEEKEKKDTFSVKTAINKWMRENQKVWSPRWIGPSKLYDKSVAEFVRAYLVGLPDDIDFDSRCRMDLGDAIHKVVQRTLIKMEAVDPATVEHFVVCPEYGWGGNIDGVILPEKILPKTQLKACGKDPTHLEIKTCGDHIYEKINTVDDISLSYRMQSEMYLHSLVQKGYPRQTLFVFINSTTWSMKCLVYRPPGRLLQEAIDKSNKIWEWVGRREIPDEFGQVVQTVETTKPTRVQDLSYVRS